MTNSVSDEQIIAFLHDELDDASASKVEAAINADPVIAARAELFLQQDGQVRDAFAAVLNAPVPARFTAIVEAPETANVIDLAAARAKRQRPAWSARPLAAMAASLAVGLFLGQSVDLSGSAGGDALLSRSGDGTRIASALEQTLGKSASGAQVELAGIGTVRVDLTFKTGDDRICRQFSLKTGANTNDAVACRAGAEWELEAFGRRSAAPGEMRLAAGEAAPGVVAAVDALIAGDPLVGEAESRVLR